MHRTVASLIVALSLGFAGSAMAREIEDGKLLVYPVKENKYHVGDFTGDKVSFYGYAGDKLESKHITALLLKKGENASAEQKHIVYVAAKTLQIAALIEIDGKEQPIVEAAPPPPAPAPAPAEQPAVAPVGTVPA
jgi:hypothetical protein